MGSLAWKFFLLAFVALGVGLAQDSDVCDPDTKVAYDPPKTFEDVIPLFGLMNTAPPASCGDFNPGSLSACQGDLLFETGCCDAACAAVSDPVSVECYDDLFAAVCQSLPDSVDLIGNLAARCKVGYVYKGCSNAGGVASPAEATDPTPDADAAAAAQPGSSPDVDVEALAELEEGLAGGNPAGSTGGDVTEEQFHRDAGVAANLYGTFVGVAALLAVVVA